MSEVLAGLPDLAQRTSLREQVAVSLRSALISGAMRPGVTYSIPALADQFRVSATPVREAMLDLVNEGIVAPVPNKGFRVVELSDAELDDITELRRLLEVPTVGSVSGQLDETTLRSLRKVAKDVARAARSGDLEGYVEGDRAFHLQLLGAAGNERLVALVDRLRAQSRLYALEDLVVSGGLVASAQEHLDLLDAVHRGDRRAAERMMQHHLSHVRGMWARHRQEES